MSESDVFLVNLFMGWLQWYVFAVISCISMHVRFGRDIVVVHTWVEAVLSWIFWGGITTTAIVLFAYSKNIPLVVDIGPPNSLSGWISLGGGLLMYFGFFVMGVEYLKLKARKKQ